MKRFFYIIILGCIITLTSCQTLEVISFEQLIPGDLSFPAAVKQVGVVNNVNINAPDNNIILQSDTVRAIYEIARQVTYHRGDPVITTESLAQNIADANYFDVVVVCDSALRANDIAIRETTLSPMEVNELAEDLKVDLIVALENIQLKAIRTVGYYDGNSILGVVDLKVFPTIKLYLPSRNAPLVAIHGNDSIFWDGIFNSVVRAQTRVISEEKMIEEASVFAGSIPVKYFIPYWKSVERPYYKTNKAAMRDASIMVKNNSWDEAYKLWQKVYQSKKQKDQMRAAFNMALYHEINDNIDEAISWAEKSMELAKSIEDVKEQHAEKGENTILIDPQKNKDFYLTYLYTEELKKRKEQHTRLQIQLQRFEAGSE